MLANGIGWPQYSANFLICRFLFEMEGYINRSHACRILLLQMRAEGEGLAIPTEGCCCWCATRSRSSPNRASTYAAIRHARSFPRSLSERLPWFGFIRRLRFDPVSTVASEGVRLLKSQRSLQSGCREVGFVYSLAALYSRRAAK